ncbi:hypothetical protein PYK79_54795 [Streptomyces sp. ID05-04B]|nr:hypothetical protein C6376_42620 [Streptomyces sp. P3]MDX5570552.1 hypothetical protein [Streptomyces sp. ID05-04B]
MTARYGQARTPRWTSWGYGRSLERAASRPPRRRTFVALPRIRSESPATGTAMATGGKRAPSVDKKKIKV